LRPSKKTVSKSAHALEIYNGTPPPKGPLLKLNHEKKGLNFHRPPRELSILFGGIIYGCKVDDEEALHG
jgi:hypothetical protein